MDAMVTARRQIQTKPASMPPPVRSGLLQRKCACGTHASGSGECAECRKKKHAQQDTLMIGQSNDPLESEADRVVERVLHTPAHGESSPAFSSVQRRSGPWSTARPGAAPASVRRVLADPGMPLQQDLRRDMERRFGHDFSPVRVHATTAAHQSAREVDADAYTVGHNIVFAAGRFDRSFPRHQPGRGDFVQF